MVSHFSMKEFEAMRILSDALMEDEYDPLQICLAAGRLASHYRRENDCTNGIEILHLNWLMRSAYHDNWWVLEQDLLSVVADFSIHESVNGE